ncbi:hypothetical protein AB1Y20_022655 [Prymnesium parvum]|uniref:Dolichol kinase n=1 Tax=Prymnesium parvum TaxID=97485 RepID=A0AB34JK52_PRYPA
MAALSSSPPPPHPRPAPPPPRAPAGSPASPHRNSSSASASPPPPRSSALLLRRGALYASVGVLFTLQLSLLAHRQLGSPVIRISPPLFGLMLLTLAVFLAVAKLLPLHAGRTLRSRILDADANWRSDPTRSFIELFACVAVLWSTYAAGHRLGVSVACAVLSSLVIIFCGEMLTEHIRALEGTLMLRWDMPGSDPKKRVGCSMGVLSLFAWSGIGLIYEHVSDLVLASSLATAVFLLILLTARVTTAFPPTRRMGELLQDRILRPATNWASHPLRSSFESCCCMGVCALVYGAHSNPIHALQAGTIAGMLSVLYTELSAQLRLLDHLHRAAALACAGGAACLTEIAFAFCFSTPREVRQRVADVFSPR